MSEPLLQVTDLVKHYSSRGGKRGLTVKAVDGVSFSIARGETLGLVGESGSGKTTVGLSVLHLLPVTSGTITLEGRDVLDTDRDGLKSLRRKMQIIFQDPVAALDPRRTAAESIAEGLRIQGICGRSDARERSIEMLERVGLSGSQADRYPHEFSGGQLQRIGIARALIVGPELVVCDEPVSALDVSIQAQIINLLVDLQSEHLLSYLFVAHNLAVVHHIADRVAVMYLGKIVEIADTVRLFGDPQHPYTRALMSAVPTPDTSRREARVMLRGEPPSPTAPPSGCRFRTRCEFSKPECAQRVPELIEIAPGHWAACHLLG